MAKGGTTGAPVPEDPAARQPVRVRFIRWFDSLGLARKIYLLYALLLVLPLVLITLFLARNAYQDAIRKAMTQGMSVIGQAQIRAEEGLNGCMHAFQLARSNKRFMEVLTTPRSYSTLELLEFKRNSLSNVEAIKDINPDFASLDIYTANPFMYEFFPTVHYLDTVRDEAWYLSLIHISQGIVR